jgi:radical SAM superfamily enzyme YgiQ (UPF0313 family)
MINCDITLIAFPTAIDAGTTPDTAMYRPPLGTLVVADIFERCKMVVDLVDPALEWAKCHESQMDALEFPNYFAELLVKRNCTYYGFSTIAGSMPFSILLAKKIKNANKDAIIIFGGPGASSVANALMEEFREIDFILYGEAEGTLEIFVEQLLSKERNFEKVPNLIYRLDSTIIKNPQAALPTNFNPPRYDRWGYAAELSRLPMEVGRGCPYHCTFCSTNSFFSQKYRVLPTDVLVKQIEEILTKFKPLALEFVHDLFTVRQDIVKRMCEQLLSSDKKMSWSCSSHLNCYSEELLELMAKSGCSAIIFGIESASPRMQKIIKKNLPLEKVFTVAAICAKNGIVFTPSYIIGFPEESLDELRATVNQFLDILAFSESSPIICMLSPLGGSEYFKTYKDKLVFIDSYSRLAYNGTKFRNEEMTLIKNYPLVFPEFYSFPDSPLPQSELRLIESFLTYAAQGFRYLAVGLRLAGYDGLDVILEWSEEIKNIPINKSELFYYDELSFYTTFIDFYKKKILERRLPQIDERILLDFVAFYDIRINVINKENKLQSGFYNKKSNGSVSHACVSISRLPVHLTTATLQNANFFVPTSYIHTIFKGRYQMSEVDQRLGILYELCDGNKTKFEIIQLMMKKYPQLHEVFIEEMLHKLIIEGYIE